MDLSKTTRYALLLMSYMASSEETYHTSAGLHSSLGIPKQYLRRLMTKLTKKNLLISDKGRTGGFSLAHPKKEIFLSDIITAVDDTPLLQSCALGFEKCGLAEKCPLHDKWMEIREKIYRVFKTMTLADMDIQLKNQLTTNL
jgi:Rrf2 family protein